MFVFYANKVCLRLEEGEEDPLVSGAREIYRCRFVFSPEWDGLERTAVFSTARTRISVLLDESNQCRIPWEVLTVPGCTLYAGVYGTKNGTVVMPTVRAAMGEICSGTALGEDAREPEPGIYETILTTAASARDLAQSLRQDADAGVFDGADGVSLTHAWKGTFLEVTSASGTTSADLRGPAGANGQSIVGPRGPVGPAGEDGVSARHNWNGTVLTVHSASGSSSADLQGPAGPAGAAGKTPVKGTDYFTEADKQELVNAVLAAIPDGNGVAY